MIDPLWPGPPVSMIEAIREALRAQAGLTQIDVESLPPGVEGFPVISTLSPHGACTRTVQYRSSGGGRPPRIETRTDGACAPQASESTDQPAKSDLSDRSGRGQTT